MVFLELDMFLNDVSQAVTLFNNFPINNDIGFTPNKVYKTNILVIKGFGHLAGLFLNQSLNSCDRIAAMLPEDGAEVASGGSVWRQGR